MSDPNQPVVEAGPGKYDDEATFVRALTSAACVGLIVIGGNRGTGFAVQGTPEFVLALPDLLEALARDIRAQNHRQSN
jgi:hypothetical protein